MSAPLMFVRDGRTLPFVPVTTQALTSIAAQIPARRRAYARSLYLALLELANDQRADRAAVSRKTLGEQAGCSPDLVSDLGPALEEAGVVQVIARAHDGQRLENEWVIVEPQEIPAPVAASHDPRGCEPQQTLEEKERTDGVNPPSPNPGVQPVDEVQVVWDAYDEHVMKPNRMRRRLDATARRLIINALKVRSVDECCDAVRGLAASPHHNGKNESKKKWLDLRYALRGNSRTGETAEQRIDTMREAAAAAPTRAPMRKKSDPWADGQL